MTQFNRDKIPAGVLACGVLLVCTWPVSWTTSDPVLAEHIWMQIAFAFGVASLFVFGVRRTDSINPWVGFFVLIVVASNFFSQYEPPALGLVLNRKHIFSPSTLAVYTVFLGVGWYAMVVLAFEKDTIKWMLDAFCLVALTNIAFVFLQWFGIDPINAKTTQCLGLAPNRNITSALLAFCMPAFFRKKWAWCLVLYPLAMAAVKTTGGFVSACLGLVLFLGMNGHWQAGAIGCAAAIGAYILFVDRIAESASVRAEMVRLGMQHFKEHPWLGFGAGQWKTLFHDIYHNQHLTKSWHATGHNEYIQALLEYGVLFVVWLGGYLSDIALKIKNNKQALSLVALVIILSNSIINFPFKIPCTGIIGVTWLAILQIELKETVHGGFI